MRPTIHTIGGHWPGKLLILSRPRGNEWLEDELQGLAQAGVDVMVSLLTDHENHELGLEQEFLVAESKSLDFISFPITDYGVPESQQEVFELVLTLDEFLSQGKTVGIHCRQGIGRSSLITACLLCLSNDDVDQCFKKIAHARGTNVPDTEEQKEWVRTFAHAITSQTINP